MDRYEASSLNQGIFTISLDFELIWGTLDLFGPDGFRKACEIERGLIGRLLDLFAEFEVSATWCILGHLFLDSCHADGGCKHPEIVRPEHHWFPQDWFVHDPCGNEQSDPLFYGRSLVEKICACPVPQEIGCHSFSHVIFGDNGCSRETARSELAACIRLAKEQGIELRSFAFPRNQVGHLEVLKEFGFLCYRGPEPVWHEARRLPDVVKRLARLWEVLTVATPPTVVPRKSAHGLWDIPGSMIYFPMHGFRKHLPVSWRIRRAIKGLDDAARRKRVFHLWFHPTNLADQEEQMFLGLRKILEHARCLRDQGRLAILSMTPIVELHESIPQTAP